MNSKNKSALLSFLGLCRRAGKMKIGYDIVKESITKNEPQLVIMASDISAHTESDIKVAAQKQKINVEKLTSCTKQELGIALGSKVIAVLSINDDGFAKKTMSLMVRYNEEECNL